MTSFGLALTFAALAFSVFVSDVIACDDDVQLTLYNVRTSNPQDIVNAFSGLPVRHVYRKSQGAGYYVVVENDQSDAVQHLQLRTGIKVTPYPVGNVCGLALNSYGVKGCQPFIDAQFDTKSGMASVQLDINMPPKMKAKEVAQLLQGIMDAYTPYFSRNAGTAHHVVGKAPIRVYFFLQASLADVERMVDDIALAAGHGIIKAKVERVQATNIADMADVALRNRLDVE